MQTPKVSIVTPSFNQARFLPQTLESVRSQTYRNIEHIIIDGASTDGTVEILRATPNIKWVSEPDRGQADALNKGFSMASGEVLCWLCSDDTLSDSAVATAVDALNRTEADLVYGVGEWMDEDGRFLGLARVTAFDFRLLLCCDNWIPQPTVFFRRSLLERVGPLRTEFDHSFDYEMWLRMSRCGRFVFVPELRAQLRAHSAAKTTARPDITRAEFHRIRAEYWEAGGLSEVLLRKPLFYPIHHYYRLKRRLRWYRLRGALRNPGS